MYVFNRLSMILVIGTVLFCVLSMANSCTTRSGITLQPASGTVNEDLQEELSAIPFPVEPGDIRRASIPAHQQIPGTAEWMHGPGSYDYNVAPFFVHRMPAPADGMCWAIYRLSAGGFPPLEALLSVQTYGREYYLGHADFSSGRWRFLPAQEGPLGTVTLSDNNVSPLGYVYVVTAVHDGALIDVRTFSLVTDEPGWTTVTVDSFFSTPRAVELLPGTQNQQPRIAVLTEKQLHYYHTYTSSPVFDTVWTSVVAATASGEQQFLAPLEATFVDWKPAMVYFRHDEDVRPRYTYGTEWVPEDGQWVSNSVGTSHPYPGKNIGLVEFDGRPHIAFPQPVPPQRIMLASASSAAPSESDWTDSLISELAIRPSLAVVNDVLACSYISVDGSSRLGYARALVADPEGAADWTGMDAYGDYGPADFGMSTKLIASQFPGSLQAPFIVYSSGGLGFPRALVGTEAIPLSASDWNHSLLDGGHGVNQHNLDITLVAGVPTVTYVRGDSELRFARAVGFQPDDEEDWEIQTLVYSSDIGAISVASYANNAAIAYIDRSSNELIYSYFE